MRHLQAYSAKWQLLHRLVEEYRTPDCQPPSRVAQGAPQNPMVMSAYRKYGDLQLSVLIICREEDLLMYEQACLDAFDPPYNFARVAGKVTWTPELRAKLSVALSAYQAGPNKPLGRPVSDEAKAKISAANKGRKLSSETRAKMSAGRKGRKMPPGFAESASERARKENLSPETRAKISASKMGNQYSKGVKRSAETCAKMSEAQRRRRQRERA